MKTKKDLSADEIQSIKTKMKEEYAKAGANEIFLAMFDEDPDFIEIGTTVELKTLEDQYINAPLHI